MPTDGRPSGEHDGGRDQTLSNGDQTLSDRDQTLSDRDQTLSDRDQTASDADQAAADDDRAHGHGTATYDHSAAVRNAGTRQRFEAGVIRENAASTRDAAARGRDELAAERDREAQARDALEVELDGDGSEAHSRHLEELRARAARARERAAADRAHAARDRELAARDREQAAHERHRAGTDELTGARRRGVGVEELQREIGRVRRTGDTLVVVFVDVDKLKAVNDGLGHVAGDALLREVVEALKRHMRCYDLLVRLGGDEFLAVLSEVTLEQARHRFDTLNAELGTGRTEGSVSFGFAELQDGESAADLIDRADRDLLAARKTASATPGLIKPNGRRFGRRK
jgi:diguanylate cyclase (GGDEF)-like protein